MNVFFKNIFKILIIGFAILFAGLVIIFLFSRFLIVGDPVLPILFARGLFPTPENYQTISSELGFDKPLIVQFFIFLGNFFTGQWYYSLSIYTAPPVQDLLRTNVPVTIEILLLPLIVGTIAGIILGLIAAKSKHKKLRRIIQLLSAIGYAIPIFLLGLLFQNAAFQSKIFPFSGYKTLTYIDPSFVTGFRILDSILEGKWYLAMDIAYHYILPWISLIIIITIQIARFISSNWLLKKHNTSLIYNTARIGLLFGLIFGYAILVDLIFALEGFGYFFIMSIFWADYYSIQGILFTLILITVIVTFIANILYIVYHHLIATKKWPTKWIQKEKEVLKEEINENFESNLSSFTHFKNYFLTKLKSPVSIIGLIIFIFFLIVSIFPQILTPYNLMDLSGTFTGEWNPPSPGHPLGQGRDGKDLLALIVYGIQDAIIFCFLANLIGVIGGLTFGFLANKRFFDRKNHRWIRGIIMGGMLLFYIFPILILVPLIELGFMSYLYIFGILLIPLFTRIFVYTEYKIFDILKKLIIYLPILIGFTIIVYSSVYSLITFLGFHSLSSYPIGSTISEGRSGITTYSGALLWPGLFFFLFLAGFILLYEGLQDYPK